MRRLPWLLPAALTLAGCDNFLIGKEGLIRDRSQDYEISGTVPRLQVPTDLNADPMREILVVPDIGTAAIRTDREYKVPRPEFFYAEAGNEVVNLSRADNGKLIVVDEPIEQVWKEVESFWAYNGVAISHTDKGQGIIETDWVTDESTRPGFFARVFGSMTFNPSEGAQRDKVRTLLSPAAGSDPGRTAIRLQHVRAPESQSEVNWSAQAESLSYKSQIMYDLLHYLSKATEKSTATSLQARNRGESRAFFGRDAQGQPVLKLTSGVDTSWELIDRALTGAAVDVGSSNRELGKYYVTYETTLAQAADEESGGGVGEFFAWLHGEREELTIDTSGIAEALGAEGDDSDEPVYSSKPVEPRTEQEAMQQSDGYKIWLGDKVIYVFGGSDGSVTADEAQGTVTYSGRYQVQVTRRSSGVYVSVLDDRARPAPAIVAEDLLWAIKEHLPAS